MQKLTKSILKEKIDNLEEYFSKYKNKTSSKQLEEVRKRIDTQEYKIAVVANMSSGKSTFINALFGKDVLPSFNHATTDSATYIYSQPDIEKKAKIFFSNNQKSIEIIYNLEEEIKQYGQKDEDCKNDKYKNVDKIELSYPFKNLQTSSNEDFNITFIDTPGPNSTGDYEQKHKDQTRSVLNSVDMALFLFDYGQLDANLKSDEQGLWHTIQTRYQKDDNFEVYFLINKIDMAMEDNFKEVESIEEAQKHWYIHEQKAIDKLKKAALDNGINNPRIYTVSSNYSLLNRHDKSFRSPLKSFKNQFEDIFDDDKWEEEFIKYLGVDNLEKDINNYINSSVKERILKIASDNILDINNDELRNLNERIQIFSKPKAEAQESIEKALNFLDGEANYLEKDMLNRFKKSEEKYKKDICNLILLSIENELTSKNEDMTKITIAYIIEIAQNTSSKLAEKRAKSSLISLDGGEFKIELEKEVNVDSIIEDMQKFMKILFEEYKNNYLDVKTDLKNSYSNYEREITKSFRQAKDTLNNHLQDALDIDMQTVEMQTIDIDSTLSFDVAVPASVLDYKYQKAKYKKVSTSSWWNPFSWGDEESIKTQNEKHILIINPKDLEESISKNMKETIDKFSGKEQQNYIDAIITLRRENSDIFQDFKINKQKEIDKLEIEIQNSEKELAVVEKQLKDFTNATKE